MFTLLWRKMRNTKWMVLCLFLGFLMAAGMMSTIPIYMDASLQRMLVKDMEQFQIDTGKFPGLYTVDKTLQLATDNETQLKLISDIEQKSGERVGAIGMSTTVSKTTLIDNFSYIATGQKDGKDLTSRVKLVGMTDYDKHIKIVRGEMPTEPVKNGVYQGVASEEALKILGINIGTEYKIISLDTSIEPYYVCITGVYEQLTDNDSYWAETMEGYLNAIFIDFETVKTDLIPSGKFSTSDMHRNYALDYQSLDMNRIGDVTAIIEGDPAFYAKNGYTNSFEVSDIVRQYTERADKLTRILWILQIPALVMLAFYLFMVSQLNVDRERNEIAVFKSRGASSKQVFGLYAAQSGILGLVTLVFAPFIGLALCQFLGVSNGFLEFVNRTGIAAKITSVSIVYALLAVVVFFLTTMIPIIPASKLTIVQYKASKTKVVKMSLWEKLFIDVILLATAFVFHYFHTLGLTNSIADGTFVATGEIDPLLFIFSTLMILGFGLLFIRIYPYLLRIVYYLGRPFWSPSQYMAITTVCRSQGGKERFLMLFLVITFSFGLFSANTARAINNNISDRIYYENGADVTITEFSMTSSEEGGSSEYVETDFERYEKLEGVEIATKVLINDKVKMVMGKKNQPMTLMAIEPDKFAQTAWFRNDLLPVHWWNYTNALVENRTGVIISSGLAEKTGAKQGDVITFKWAGNDNLDTTVMAIVDYWPGMNPNSCDFAVMNYSFVRSRTIPEPYQIWLKMKEGATSEALYESIEKARLPIEQVKDSAQMLIAEKTDPSLQGMNGALTLGFVIIMLMTIIGFLIYWILSIRSRTLQFGILRAMGVSFREIIGILGYEQILVSGVSIACSFIIGGVVSDLFVPLFQFMYAVDDQIPPFRVAAMQADYIKMYIIIGLMLIGGFAILGALIRKININKALKLGED